MIRPFEASGWIFFRLDLDEFLMGPLMDHGIWKWIKSYRAKPFQFETHLLVENEPGRWSPLASRVESTAYCELLLVNPLLLFLSVFLSLARTLVAPVSKRGGSFYNRIYRRTGGTTKRTRRGEEDIVWFEIQIASKLCSTDEFFKWTQRSLDRDWIGFELNLRLFVHKRNMTIYSSGNNECVIRHFLHQHYIHWFL